MPDNLPERLDLVKSLKRGNPRTPRTVPLNVKGYAHTKNSWWSPVDDEENPDLQWPNSVRIYDQMRKQDAQVVSVLRAVILPVLRTDWRIDQAGARETVTRFVAENLNLPIADERLEPTGRTNRFSWTEHLELALLSLVFGHAFFEQQYELVDRMYRLKKLEYRPPRTIASIQVARDGGLDWIEQFPLSPGDDTKIEVGRLVGYVHGKEGGNWTGVSILRPAFAAWYLKTKALRTQAQSFERNGLGIPVYTASEQPEGLNPEEIVEREDAELEEGEKLAQAYRAGESAGAAIPHGASLDLKGVDGKVADMDKGIRLYNEEIARAVLANFLSLGQETGSWALGETFENFFTLSLQTIARSIAETATRHIVEDLVDVNFGPDEPAPRITFDEIGSRHPATAEAIMALVQVRAITPDDRLEDYLRNMYALPEIDPATRRLPDAGEGTQSSDAGQQDDSETPEEEGDSNVSG